MARPSKLTDAQWETVRRRVLAGERPADLAREYGVSKASISVRVSKPMETVRDVAQQLVAADAALKALPVHDQLLAQDLAADLKAISHSLAQAARLGAATAHRLAGIANNAVQRVDDAKPLEAESVEALKGVSALTKLANEAGAMGLNLLNANKDRLEQAATKTLAEELGALNDAYAAGSPALA